MVHVTGCNTIEHREPTDGSEPEPCRSRIVEVGTAAVWLEYCDGKWLVKTDIPPVLRSLREATEFARAWLELMAVPAVRAGPA